MHAAYIQDWLTQPIDAEGQKQAAWRTDPARAGQSAVLADIGVHAFNLACFVSGREAEAVAADLFTAVPGRRLDDNANVLVRWSGGARGTILASQTSPGHYNDLSVRIYGDKARPRMVRPAAGGTALLALWRGERARWSAAAMAPRREPAGFAHAGGASGRLYRGLRQPLPRRRRDHPAPPQRRGCRPGPGGLVPDVEDGARGVKFVAAAVASNDAGGAWTAARFG